MVQTARFTGVARQIIDTRGYTLYCYHGTDVVKVANCRSHVVLDSGGYRTYTTKLAMNQAFSEVGIRLRVVQIAYTWYVKDPHGPLLKFTDGMIIKLN